MEFITLPYISPARTLNTDKIWARWGVSNPPVSYGWDGLSPVPAASVPGYPEDPEMRAAIRLVVA